MENVVTAIFKENFKSLYNFGSLTIASLSVAYLNLSFEKRCDEIWIIDKCIVYTTVFSKETRTFGKIFPTFPCVNENQ